MSIPLYRKVNTSGCVRAVAMSWFARLKVPSQSSFHLISRLRLRHGSDCPTSLIYACLNLAYVFAPVMKMTCFAAIAVTI